MSTTSCFNPSYIPAIATVVAAFIGGFWILYISGRTIKRNASIKFISQVLTCLSEVYPFNDIMIDGLFNTIKSSYIGLNSAVYEFGFHLKGKEREQYYNTWSEYNEWRKNLLLESGSPAVIEITRARNNPKESFSEEFKNHIRSLLKFASQK